MNQNASRRLLTEGVIGLAVCAGAYLMLVEPAERRLSAARAEIDSLKQRAAAAAAAMPAEKVREAHRLVEAARRAVIDRERVATDEAAMFGAVMALAERHGVRVDQLLPTPAKQVKTGEGETATVETRRGYSMVVSAEYGALAAFVGEVQERVGLTRVRAIRLSPDSAPGSRSVLATIETEHLSLGLAGAARSDAGGGR